MKEGFLRYLLSPYTVALVISLLIIGFLPDYFNRYEVEMVDRGFVSKETVQYYQDLDNDGVSEDIKAQVNTVGAASYVLYDSNGDLIDQFNLDYAFADDNDRLWFQDNDENGFYEIYVITQNKDSLFLNIHEPFGSGSMKKNIFIDTVLPHNGKYDIRINSGNDNVGSTLFGNEIIFPVRAGFSGYPRNIYKYLPTSDTIIKSPHLGNVSIISDVIDINGDGRNEVIVSNVASGNTLDPEIAPRSDHSTWVTILDSNLNHFFEPLEIPAIGSMEILPVKNNNEYHLLAVFRSKAEAKRKSSMFYLDLEGNITKELELDANLLRSLVINAEDEIVVLSWKNGMRYVIDLDLNNISSESFEPSQNINAKRLDIDMDGATEWIVSTPGGKEIHIFNEDATQVTTVPLENPENSNLRLGRRLIDPIESLLHLQIGINCFTYSYRSNPLYNFQYALYLLIYLLILGIVFLIAKGQRHRLEQKRKLETKISALQIRAIKNQVDPHFVFNAINTISEMTLMDNKLDADRFICRFSDFMRGTLKSSDQIVTTLKEELDYTENFIQLQQIRYGGKFSYQINMDLEVNQNYQVPKHVLFCYVENAIKHGLASKDNGSLRIEITEREDKLKMTVSDNGGGLNGSAAPEKHSTGSGLSIMDQIFGLYSKLNKQKISKKVTEIIGENGNAEGVEVSINIDNPVIRAHEN